MSKNQKLLIILVIGGAALWAALRLLSPASTPESSVAENVVNQDMPLPATGTGSPSPTTPADAQNPAKPSEAPLLGPQLRKIGECLGIKNTLNDSAEMTFAALDASISNELGGLVDKNLDWKNVHVTLPSGEKRRIRMEVEGVGEEGAQMKLKYFGVDNEDLPVPIHLPEEQSTNPSETFIATLEGEGQVTLREEAHRGLYTKGSELYYVERNGALSELEIMHNGRSVKCQDLQGPQGTCNCF